ncbi:LysR family transcriptional regulator [Pseudomonas promysalinigenes]|uniref:LysR family transcriptional regulator n=1 Tax=Pseudomonas promysalinigenes TaxID=485898 RepID=A0ABY6ASW6_9PSED|nr:LysR family transcriptional regulator [Pseudomonas promysalinigenes]QXI35789.1 LysR family transcriptional regulator [Pseudomonas promysalinigenes]UXH42157.1 LysR family transcriptional regulator [Pseudomonas promysalinigenes]
MDMLHAMRTFARVVECGSFAAAANALDISAAQVSRIVAELENQLQTRLLHRTTRRLRMSEAGERFLERARQIMALTDEAMEEARGAHLTPRGRLRLHCPHGLGMLLMPLVADYNTLYPDVAIELTLSQRNPDPLAEGHDVVITVDQALPDSQLIAVPLGTIFSIPCAAPSYLANHGVPERPADLHEHRCLRMAYPMHEGDWVFPQGVDHCVIAPRDSFLTNVADAMLVATELGMGIGLLPFYTASQSIEQGRLRRLLAPYRLRENALYAIYPSRHYLDAKVRTWIDYLKERLPELFEAHARIVDEPRYWS